MRSDAMTTHLLSVRPLPGAVVAGTGDDDANDAMTRLTRCIRRAVCGIRGHDQVLQFTHDRLCLHCVDCGMDTPGWTIGMLPRPDARRR
jgi:hypothetical protein